MKELIETSRFGAVEYDAADVISFTDGMLGFPNARSYLIIQHKENSPFRWLQNIEFGDLAFLVVDPAYYVNDYAPELSDQIARELSLSEESPRLVYTMVTIPKGKPNEMTLNLAGPLLINLENRSAKQIILEDQRYPIRYKVFAQGEDGNKAA